MRIISDITGKEYKTVDECLAAEKKFMEEKAAKEKAQKEFEAKKEEAYQKAIKACEEYFEVCGIDFKETENGYKVSFCGPRDNKTDKIFEDILNAWLN